MLLIWNPVTFPKRERGAEDKVCFVMALQCQLEIVILQSPFSTVKRQYKWLLLFSCISVIHKCRYTSFIEQLSVFHKGKVKS